MPIHHKTWKVATQASKKVKKNHERRFVTIRLLAKKSLSSYLSLSLFAFSANRGDNIKTFIVVQVVAVRSGEAVLVSFSRPQAWLAAWHGPDN
jgi:hypothetical protein